jgi:hypothetical protein
MTGHKMAIPENFLLLHSEEERVRLVSLDHIASDTTLHLHASLVEASMTALEHFSAGWLTDDLDLLTVQHLGLRLFNGGAAALKLLLAGYYQNAASHLRDVLETAFLLDYLGTDPQLVAKWREAESKKDRREFEPVHIRTALDARDGFTEQKRAEHYRRLSTLAHPNPKAFVLLRPTGSKLANPGPFHDAGLLKALLEEMGKVFIPATVNYLHYFSSRTPIDQATRDGFFAVANNWFQVGYSTVPTVPRAPK